MKMAFCPVLWTSKGGTLKPDGGLSLEKPVRGYCATAYDCSKCPRLLRALASIEHQQSSAWVCPDCASIAAEAENSRLAGYYSEGQCQRTKCRREDRWSPLLQLLVYQGQEP